MSRTKLLETYDFIKQKIYLCSEDFSLSKNKFNSALILGLLSASLDGKILYTGEYGLGKTTLAESIASLTSSLPRSIVSTATLKGHPELSYEHIIGRPHLGKLNQGEEKVIWSNFVNFPVKVVDEVNRIPEQKQNLLLTGMQDNVWSYLNETKKSEVSPWFGTKNYEDGGNFDIIPPLKDRFDIAVESKNPGVNITRLLRFKNTSTIDYPDIKKKYEDLLKKDESAIDLIKKNFADAIKKDYDLELLTNKDFFNIKKEISNIPYDLEANYFFDALTAELGSCQVYGQKRTTDTCPDGCHYSKYSCFSVKNTLSIRSINAINNYSKALAWLDGKDEVTPLHVAKITPYVLWHKTAIKDEFFEKSYEQKRQEPTELNFFQKEVENIKRRASKIKKEQDQVIKHILNGDVQQAASKAKSLEHPVFKEYLK